MTDMIPIEALVGIDNEGDYWVRLKNLDDTNDVFDRGPFQTQEEAEEWITVYMETWGGINMGSIYDTKH